MNRERRAWRRAALVAALIAASVGCLPSEVVRVVDGEEVTGRYVSDWAYASYARGIEWEQRAQYEQALRFFEEAAERDPDSVEVRTRIAALQCRLDRVGDSFDSFARAEQLDAAYEPLWRARALCAERAGADDDALAAAARAVSLDPLHDEAVLLYARLLDAAGRHHDAARWLRDVSLRSPFNRRVWEAIEAHATDSGDRAWLQEARKRLRALRDQRRQPQPSVGWPAVDEALVGGSLPEARRRLRRAHLDPRLLATRAILVGRPALALEEAELRLGANPDDGDARVAVALAADLLGKLQTLSDAMARLPADTEPLSETAELLLAELLVRHVGAAAAADWLGVAGESIDVDSLRQQLRRSYDKGIEQERKR